MEKVCVDRFERFGTAGNAEKISSLSLTEMAKNYQDGKLDPLVD